MEEIQTILKSKDSTRIQNIVVELEPEVHTESSTLQIIFQIVGLS